MELLLGLAMLGGCGYAAWHLGCQVVAHIQNQRVRDQSQQTAAIEANVRDRQVVAAQRAAYHRLNQVFKHLQFALLTLDQAPDFQRAASWAEHANDVPVSYRQQLFQRHRPKLVQFMARRLATGGSEEHLLQSLTALIQALGVAPFEADYIADEARRGHARSASTRTYEQQLRQLQATHEQRMNAIRGLEGVDGDTWEQLLETEQARFGTQLCGSASRHIHSG